MALYLVTGGAGFIGSHIASALVARGDRVRVLDDFSGGKLENLASMETGELGSGAPVEVVRGDVSDPAAIGPACAGVEGVFHEAALVSVPVSVEHPDESFRINIRGTFEALRAARANDVRSFVIASSAAVYGTNETVPKVESMTPEPVSPYAGDKLAAEAMLSAWGHSFGIKTVALRYFNVFGPRQSDDSPYSGVIALLARKCLEQNPVTIFGDGEQTRDFVFVEDVAAANLLAIDSDIAPGSVFNVGSGSAVSVNSLYREVWETLDAARGGSGTFVAPDHGPTRAGDVRHSLADISAIRGALGFEPRVSRLDGLSRTLDWYRAQA